MTTFKYCERLENIINLAPHFIKSKVYVIPDQYFLRFQEGEDHTEVALSKLECHVCGAIILVDIWKKKFKKIIGFDLSSEYTELLFYTNSHIHVYSFFNSIIEHVKDIDFRSILPTEIQANKENVTKVLPIYSTLQKSQFITCLDNNQTFYLNVDVNKDVLLQYAELHRAQCCSLNLEFIFILTNDGFLCKYNSLSGSPVGDGFNVHSVIPKPDGDLQFHLLCVSHNNKDVCIVDEQGSAYLFQMDEEQSDIETGLDICSELGIDSTSPSGLHYATGSKKRWSFLDKIIKKNKQDEMVYLDPSPVQSTSSVTIIKDIIPDPSDLQSFSVEFLTQGLAIWTVGSAGSKYRIFSRDKGELLCEYHFNKSCLLRDSTVKHEDPLYQFITTEQSLVIPLGSESGCKLFNQEIEAFNSCMSSKWGHLLKLISSAHTPLQINDVIIIQLLHTSFVHMQLDIVDFCLDYHLNHFARDMCEPSLNWRSVTSSVCEGSSTMTSSGEGSVAKSQLLDFTGPESIALLDRMLEVVSQKESQAELCFYAKCLERLMAHLVDLTKLCNDRDSRKLSFEILKRIPPLTSELHAKCNLLVNPATWDLMDSAQIIYLTLHSPLHRLQGGPTIPRHQVMSLLQECIDNRDFALVQSVLNKMDYKIQDELKSVFVSTLDQLTRDFIIHHMGGNLLNEEEYKTYVCYKEIHDAYTKMNEKMAQSNENYDLKTYDQTAVIETLVDENGHKELRRRESDGDGQYDEESITTTIPEEAETSLTHRIDSDITSDCHDERFDRQSQEDNEGLVEKNEEIAKLLQESVESVEGNVDNSIDEVRTHTEQSKTKVDPSTFNIVKVSFGEFMTISKENVSEIIAQLYFQSYDDSLLEYLTKEICWKHLVECHRMEQIESWILGTASWASAKQWTISQHMIDAVHTLSTSPATREFIFNRFCSLFGVFSSPERSNILLIVSRLIQCQLLTKVEQVLSKPTSTVSLEYFTTQLILLCIQREQWTLLSCLLESSTFSMVSQQTQNLKPVKLWSYLDGTFHSPSLSPSELLQLVSSVADMLDCTSDSNVNISTYFIRTATFLDCNNDNQHSASVGGENVCERESCNFRLSESQEEIVLGLDSESKVSKSRGENESAFNAEFNVLQTQKKMMCRLESDSQLLESQNQIISGLESELHLSKAEKQMVSRLDIESRAAQGTVPGLDTSSELLASSSLYRSTLTSRDSTVQDVNLSTLLQNNPDIHFPRVLSRTYQSMKNQTSLEFNLNFLHCLKQGRPIASLYEKLSQGKQLMDGWDVNEMFAVVLNTPSDSGLVTSALNVLRLCGVDEACFATQVRAVRCLNEEDLDDIHQSNRSSSCLIQTVIEKSVSHCTGLQSWGPAVNLCKLNRSPIPEQLFDTLIRENQWMEFLVACDVFDCTDGDKLIHRFKEVTTRQHLKYALAHTLTPTDPAHSDLMELTECCHSNVDALLAASLVHSVPCLALLANALVESSESAASTDTECQCLRVYLLAGMDIDMRTEVEELSLIEIMSMAVERKCLALLEDGLQMLMPDTALCLFVSALCDFIMFDGQHTLDKLKASISAMSSSHGWTLEALVSLTHKALSLLSSFAQRELLTTLREAEFNTIQNSLDIALSKAQCLQRTDICVDFAQLWPTASVAYESSILDTLLARKLYGPAQEFSALSSAHAGKVLIVLAQWSESLAQEMYTTDVDFWTRIDADFRKASVSDADGFEYFTAASQRISSPVDRYKCLKLGLDRSDVMHVALQRQMYALCLNEDFDLTRLHGVWRFDPTVADKPDDYSPHILSTGDLTRLDHLIAAMLNAGDLFSASLVCHLFQSEHADCLVLKQMAKAATQHETGEDVLTQLCAKLRHGKSLGMFFVAAYRLLCSLHVSMTHILATDSHLMLSSISDVDLPMQCVQDFVCLASMKLTQSDIAQVIAQVIFSTLETGLHEEAVSNKLLLWGFDLITEFSRYTSLCDSTELGLCLYYKAKNFLLSQDIPMDTLRQIVELLIASHECFTSACNMEGVVSVLTQCRGLTVHLLAQSAWSLMVRLLTGIGRYVEMNYVYQLLKENQQFEFLLRKGYDKNPGFKLATLDFVRSDKTLFQLVALNFRLYSELATMFRCDADSMVENLATSGEDRLMCSQTNKSLLNDIIDNYSHAAQHFIQAQKLKQATSIVNQAELMSLQLELLKAAMTPPISTEDCLALFAIPPKDLTHIVAHHLTYQQAAVVLNAYDCPVDWSLVVYTQVVLRGNRSYLTAWLSNHRLSSNLVQDIVSRYQKESKLSTEMTSNMKYLVSHVKPLELKYRMSSQLNFKDIVHSILVNPDVSWLKDTVWQVGYKQKGGLK